MPFARRGDSLKAMSSMIALPASRLASANGSAAAVLYPVHRLAAMGSSERLGGRGGATALDSANAGAPGPSALRGRLQEPGPKRYAALLVTVVASFLILGIAQPCAKPGADVQETR
jgi:hypothetical protein